MDMTISHTLTVALVLVDDSTEMIKRLFASDVETPVCNKLVNVASTLDMEQTGWFG